MLSIFSNPAVINGLLAALVAGLFTGIGGFTIFLKKRYTKDNINLMLNIAAGVMLAASFFALLVPSMEEILKLSKDVHVGSFWYCLAVFFGVALVWLLNDLLPHEHNNMGHHGPMFSLKKAWLFIIAISLHKLPEGLAVGVAYGAENLVNPTSLVLGIALHNIPEGLAVGVAFGSLAYSITGSTLNSALALAFGIGLQNFPEGSAISLPLRREGYTRGKAFFYGQLSGVVEPIAAVIGALLVLKIKLILPFLLAFAAGAMIYVVVEELIPESQTNKKKDLMALFTILGFMVMMILDVALT